MNSINNTNDFIVTHLCNSKSVDRESRHGTAYGKVHHEPRVEDSLREPARAHWDVQVVEESQNIVELFLLLEVPVLTLVFGRELLSFAGLVRGLEVPLSRRT